MRLKPGDLEPDLVIPLTSRASNGTVTAVDLTSATTVRVVGVQGVTTVIDDDAPDLGTPTAGIVTHEWVGPVDLVPGETDEPGRIFVEVEVTWPNGRKQTFPSFGELAVDIEA